MDQAYSALADILDQLADQNAVAMPRSFTDPQAVARGCVTGLNAAAAASVQVAADLVPTSSALYNMAHQGDLPAELRA